jgi:hypothetical protein
MVTALLSDVYHPRNTYLVGVDVRVKFSAPECYFIFQHLYPIFRAFKVCELYGMWLYHNKKKRIDDEGKSCELVGLVVYISGQINTLE